MKYFKNFVTGVLLTLFSLSAFADSYLGDEGDIFEEDIVIFSNDVRGPFVDTAEFSLSVASEFSSVLFNWSFSNPGNIIDGLVLTIVGDGTGGNAFSESFNINSDSFSTVLDLPASNFDVTVSGDAGLVGIYSLSISPVPEASTIAMMLSGIGIVGFSAFRRRLKN